MRATHTPRISAAHTPVRQRWFGSEEAVEKMRRMRAADRARKAESPAILIGSVGQGMVASRGRAIAVNRGASASLMADEAADRAFAQEEKLFNEQHVKETAHVETAELVKEVCRGGVWVKDTSAPTTFASSSESPVGADAQGKSHTDRKHRLLSSSTRRVSPSRAGRATARSRSFVSTARVAHAGAQRGLRGSFFGSSEAVEKMRRVRAAARDRKAYADAMGNASNAVMPHRKRSSERRQERGPSDAGACRSSYAVALRLCCRTAITCVQSPATEEASPSRARAAVQALQLRRSLGAGRTCSRDRRTRAKASGHCGRECRSGRRHEGLYLWLALRSSPHCAATNKIPSPHTCPRHHTHAHARTQAQTPCLARCPLVLVRGSKVPRMPTVRCIEPSSLPPPRTG